MRHAKAFSGAGRSAWRVLAGVGLTVAAAGVSPRAEAALTHYWPFNESNSGTGDATDSAGGSTGTFAGQAVRTTGIVGAGAARFNDTGSTAVTVGATGFSYTTGIAIEAVVAGQWTGTTGNYDEIFRKEDGNNRILFCLQNDGNNPGAVPAVAAGPVLSFGLFVGGVYNELDMPLDGAAGRPTVAALMNSSVHHLVAQYDSTTGRKSIWVDGTERWATNYAAGSLITSGGGATAAIGNIGPGGGEPFNGSIDEVAMYDAALTGAQIAAHYANVQAGQSYFATPEPGSLLGIAGAGAVLAMRRRR